MIISMSGVDCAGKSTQIELLKQYFISRGKKCTVFWYRPGYSDQMQDLKKLVRPLMGMACSFKHGLDRWRKVPKTEAKPEAVGDAKDGKPSVPAPIWLSTAIVDTIVQWGLKLRYLNRKYDVVICDRYIEDAKLDLMLKFPQYTWTESTMKLLAHGLPKPDFAFLLMISEEEMRKRAEIKQEPFPDNEHIRQMRYRAYEFVAERDDITVIDSSGEVSETHRKIREVIEKRG